VGSAVSREHPKAAERVRSQVRSCALFVGHSGTGARSFRVLWFLLPIFIPLNVPYSLISYLRRHKFTIQAALLDNKFKTTHDYWFYVHSSCTNYHTYKFKFFIIYVLSQQSQGQLQTQHSVDTGNCIMDKNNIKSKTNYRQALEENTLMHIRKQTKTIIIIIIIIIISLSQI
jgi:hypothetical protein